MSINERIKVLRKSLSLTQIEFGEKIGLKKSASSKIEKDGEIINSRLIQLICNAFNVSEKWLLEGTGNMYVSNEDAIMEKVSRMYDLTEEQEIFARQWLQLPADVKDAVVAYVLNLADAIKNDRQDAARQPDADTPAPAPAADAAPRPAISPDPCTIQAIQRPEGLTNEQWSAMHEAYRGSVLEKNTQARSSASSSGRTAATSDKLA